MQDITTAQTNERESFINSVTGWTTERVLNMFERRVGQLAAQPLHEDSALWQDTVTILRSELIKRAQG